MAKNKIISDRLNTFFTNNKLTVGDSIPTTGTWSKGDIVISTVQTNGECGWICVEAGTPGNWEIFGAGGGGSLITINASSTVNEPVTELPLSGLGLGVSVTPKDKLVVHYNSVRLFEGIDYEIVENGTKIRKLGLDSWNESSSESLFTFELLKMVKSVNGEDVRLESKVIELKRNQIIASPMSEVDIEIEGFNKENDSLTVYKNSVYMIEGIDYDIDETGTKIVSKKGNWNENSIDGYVITFVVLKEVYDTEPDAKIGTGNIIDGVITMEKLAEDVRQAIVDAGNIDLSGYATRVDVGDKTGLLTENKDNLVSAINEVFQSGVNVKNNMVQAINSKKTVSGVNSEDTWDTITQRVNDIKEGSGNATIGDVLAGKTFTNSDGIEYTGTMANRGGAQTVTPGTANKVLNSGYYSGNITVKGDANLLAANIRSGVSIFGIAGNASVASLGGKYFNTGSLGTLTAPAWSGTSVIGSVTSLPFTPSIVIILSTKFSNGYDTANILNVAFSSKGLIKWQFNNNSAFTHSAQVNITTNGFSITATQLDNRAFTMENVTWIAIS